MQVELASMRELRTQAVDEASEWRHAAHLSASAATTAAQRIQHPENHLDGAPQLTPQWQQQQQQQWQQQQWQQQQQQWQQQQQRQQQRQRQRELSW